MRISLLLQREPFGAIFEKTVAGFLEKTTGTPSRVRWISGRPNVAALQREGRQVWLCNTFLNAIFTTTAQPYIFEPIYREFSRSRQWWKRPLQRLYVDAAIWRGSRAYVVQAGVAISPPMLNAEHCLFVGGNHKIRLLDAANQKSFGILKAGFSSQPMEREISGRQLAAKLGIPVPNLRQVASDGSWFQEDYLSGTPLNRLADQAQQQQATAEAFRALQPIWDTTAEEMPTVQLAAQLLERIQQTASAMTLFTQSLRSALQKNTEQLCRRVERLSIAQPNMLTVLTHGDFQPANILLNAQGLWLIDWEYSERRFAGYDELVFGLQSRSPAGLADRLGAWVKDSASIGFSETKRLKSADSLAARDLMVTLFLLEELALHVAENSNPQFTQLGQGLVSMLQEATTWLRGSEDMAA